MDGLVIGLDLNDDYTQISCYDKEKSWTIPTVICRRKEEESWLTGEEAYAATLLGEGVIVDKLLKLVRKDGTSTIGGTCYSGGMLLNQFINGAGIDAVSGVDHRRIFERSEKDPGTGSTEKADRIFKSCRCKGEQPEKYYRGVSARSDDLCDRSFRFRKKFPGQRDPL